MLLKKLIKTNKINSDIEIKGLALDSRKVKKGDLFFAVKGHNLDGKTFIEKAIKKGAAAVITSTNFHNKNFDSPLIKVKNITKTLSNICKKFYKNKPKNIIAVTGTNGKSSVADFFYQILSHNKIPVASIGTLGVKKNDKIRKINLTSPDIIALHKELAEIKKLKIENVIIEASSHGLNQGRLNGLKYKAGIFTNFSQDHLDYHKNMKKYFKSKMILFSKLLEKKSYIITDSEIKEFQKLKKISFKKNLRLITIKNSLFPSDKKKIELIGNFQLKNLSMAIEAAKLCGINAIKIKSTLKSIKTISGRLELVKILSNKSKVFIDYAHTPDALETTLLSLQKYFRKKITLVFGCGGNRDIKKRFLMAKIAKKYCSKIFVTDDNPRFEKPKQIRKMIISKLKDSNYDEIGSRKKAIVTAIINSNPHEIILIAGKGHETYQDYGKRIFKMSDKIIIKNTNTKKKHKFKNLNYQWNSKILNQVLSNNKEYQFNGVAINSKEVKNNNLFIAIKGKNKNGHDYVAQAIKKGASYSVVSNGINKKKMIYVKNTNNFLNDLAKFKRKNSGAKVIAVTGSAGKTTVKSILGQLLSNYSKTYQSPKSFNNHYGVPLSLSNLDVDHRYGVFEIGMSKRGEIDCLSKLVKPDLAVITNIAEAHIENFKNTKGIAKAKSEIINNITKDGTLLLNRDDKFFYYLSKIAKDKKVRVLSYGLSKKSDVYPIKIQKNKNITLLKIRVLDEIFTLKIKNINIYNVLISLGVLKTLSLDIKKILKFFQIFDSIKGRGKIYNVNRFKTNFNLIDESYNANPFSVKNAIISLANIKKNKSKKYLLLGDMLELGYKSDYYHKNISNIINNTDIDKLFVYGNKILKTYKHTKKSKRGNILQCKEDFDELFSKIINKNDYIMIKGSNATGLAHISNKIINGTTNAF